MSFDPYGYDPNKPQPGDAQLPPDGTAPVPYQMGMAPPDDALARERAQLPGVFLIALGVLNLLWVLALAFMGFNMRSLTPDKLAEVRAQLKGEQRDQFDKLEQDLKKADWSMEGLFQSVGTASVVLGGFSLAASALMILGGMRMVQLRNYGLCVFASLVTAVPFVSGSACCCLGEGVGIWAIVVLLSNEVRAAFR